MLQVSENEVKNRLHFDNPWWEKGGQIEQRFAKLPRRAYFNLFYSLQADRTVNRAIILMGPRRVGKTVMVHHSIDKLLENGASATSILYLSLETPIYTGLSLEKILNLFLVEFGYKRTSQLTIFFDEIQYLRDWEVHLKSLVDSYPTFRFIATGSAAAALRLKSRESGAGRFTEFMLPPLTFAEYLQFIGREDELIISSTSTEINYKAVNIETLNTEFINYLNYGGYPEAVFSDTIRSNSARYIKSDIVDKVLLRDLPSLYGVSDIQELNRLFTTLAYNTGNEITLENLSQDSGVAKNTLKRYLEYLEAAFLIKRIRRIDENAKHFTRATSFKVYLTNPSMKAALFGYITSESAAMGALAETAIFSQWQHSNAIENLYYARWKKGEVDIIELSSETQKPLWCTEIKWSDRAVSDHSEIEGLVNFVVINKISQALVSTKTLTANFNVKGVPLEFIPTSLLAYSIGKGSVNYKNSKVLMRKQQSRQ